MTQEPGRANLFLASRYLEMDRPEKTLDILKQADESQLEKPGYWKLRGRALLRQGKLLDAEQTAHKGLALAPEDIELLYLLYNIRVRKNDLGGAEEAILKALKQDSDNPVLLCQYANLTATGGQLDKAERLLARARASDPEHPAVTGTELTLAYLRTSDKELLRLGRERLAANPEDPFSHYYVGLAHAAAGQVRPAKRYFGNAALLDPADNPSTSAARATRFYTHWLLIPLWPLFRFGGVKVWFAAVGTLMLLRLAGLAELATGFALIYLVYVIYSWVVPPLLRRWLQRRGHRLG